MRIVAATPSGRAENGKRGAWCDRSSSPPCKPLPVAWFKRAHEDPDGGSKLGEDGLAGKPMGFGEARNGCVVEAHGKEDGLLVFPEQGQPGTDVIGVAHRRHDAEGSASEGASHLGNELFAAVPDRAEGTLLIAIKAAGMTTEVSQLVKGRPVPVDRLVERHLRRNLHIVERGDIVRFGSTDAKVSTMATIGILLPTGRSRRRAWW